MTRIAVPLELTPAATRPREGVLVELRGPTMGVSWTVKAVAPPSLDAAATQSKLQGLLNRIVGQMSTWEPQADISRFNALPAGGWMDAPSAFHHVLERGLHWAQASGGAFDPTTGRLTDLWGFGPAGPVPAPPRPAQIELALACSGWDRLAIDGRRLFQPGGLALDFSGIAKGFGVDEVSRALSFLGLPDHLVEIGGELRGQGVKPDGSPWWADIEAPPGLPFPGGPLRVALHGLSLATSGDYRRFLDHEGRSYGHTLDPRTGRPLANGVRSVSVVAADCIDADALCTVLGVLGPSEGLTFSTIHGIAAVLLVDSQGEIEEIVTPAMAAMLA